MSIRNTKKGPQEPQNLSTLKSLNIQNPTPILGILTLETVRNDFLIKIIKELLNRSTNNGDIAATAKRYVLSL